MKTREIMTSSVRCVRPSDTLTVAATVMRDHDVGAVPVCRDDNTLIGFLTDRDITVRATAEGLNPGEVTVEDAMSPTAIFTFDDQEVDQSARLMEQYQVRRLPVLDHEKHLVGILSLADMAMRADTSLSGLTLREVSKPAPSRFEDPANR